MKIALISPNPVHLNEITRMLGSAGHAVHPFEGGKTRVREVAEKDPPDLVLVDGICRDPQELAQIEWVTAHHPTIAVFLMCASHTPEFLLAAMRAGVREVLPSPVAQDTLLAAVDRIAAKRQFNAGQRGQLFAFMPCKGGSGATFLATNLGWHLAAQSGSVLLVDLSLQFGDALSFLHDGRPHATIAEVARDISRLDAALLNASTVKVAPNFSVLATPEDLAFAAEVRADQVQAILDVATQHYNFVLVDLPHSIDSITITALDRADRIYCVLQSALPDLRNATRVIKAFHALGYGAEKMELMVNRYEKTGAIGLDQIQRAVGGLRVQTIPNAWREISSSINQGEPVARNPRGPVSRQLAELASAMVPGANEPQRTLLDRIFRRA